MPHGSGQIARTGFICVVWSIFLVKNILKVYKNSTTRDLCHGMFWWPLEIKK